MGHLQGGNRAQLRDAIHSFARRHDGTSAVEYAILLALVVVLLTVGALVCADAMKNSLTGIASQMGSDAPKDAAAPQHAPSKTSPTPAAPLDAPIQPELISPLTTILLLLCVLGLLVLNHLRVARLSRNLKEDVPAAPRPEIPEALLFRKRNLILKSLMVDTRNLLEQRMLVRHLMTTEVLSVTPQTPLDEIKEAMARRRCRHVLVCKGNALVGMISDRDVVQRRGDTAAQIMTPEPITVSPDMLVFQALTLMMQRSISCLPVIQGEQVLGVVTTTDALMALQCSMRIFQQAADGKLESLGPNRGRRITDLAQSPVAQQAVALPDVVVT